MFKSFHIICNDTQCGSEAVCLHPRYLNLCLFVNLLEIKQTINSNGNINNSFSPNFIKSVTQRQHMKSMVPVFVDTIRCLET